MYLSNLVTCIEKSGLSCKTINHEVLDFEIRFQYNVVINLTNNRLISFVDIFLLIKYNTHTRTTYRFENRFFI